MAVIANLSGPLTRKCDELPIERLLTREEVNKALGLPESTT